MIFQNKKNFNDHDAERQASFLGAEQTFNHQSGHTGFTSIYR
jgi:hypothetical protein